MRGSHVSKVPNFEKIRMGQNKDRKQSKYFPKTLCLSEIQISQKRYHQVLLVFVSNQAFNTTTILNTEYVRKSVRLVDLRATLSFGSEMFKVRLVLTVAQSSGEP